MLLFYYSIDLFKCLVVSFAIVAGIIIYAFYANMRRAPDDPKKRDYHPMAILLAPFIAPFALALGIFGFILAALLYAGFLLVFTLVLITNRQSILLVWWHKFAMMIGDPLLRASTYMIKLPFPQRQTNQQQQTVSQKSPAGNL